jgi:hypothetical protein
MDPDATLAKIRELATKIVNADELGPDDVFNLASYVEDMDTWLSKGGFLPLAWQNFGGAKS